MARRYQPMAPFHLPNLPNLPATLEAAGHTWRNYADARSSYFDHIVGLVKHPWSVPASNFDTDAKAGKLPDVAWLFAPDGLSEHPGDFKHTGKPMVSLGMQWTTDRVHAAATGPLWAKTAIFITWDDWGGWYDHVVPPLASTWPGGGHAGYQNSQFRYGPRVPCLVVSPYARRGINHTFYSHASIVKFCLQKFALKAWNAPALLPHDKSGDMSESFDFTTAPRLGVPSVVPA